MPDYCASRSELMQFNPFLVKQDTNGVDFLKWYPEFQTGHAEIDQQHKETFRLANRLYAAVRAKDHPSALQSIESYLEHLKWRITYEERTLAAAGLGQELEAHSQAHRTLINDAKMAYARVAEGRLKPERFFFDVIVISDIVGHQMENDRIYAHLQRAHGRLQEVLSP